MPYISDILNQNILLVLVGTYFAPVCLYCSVFLILPIIIIKLSSMEKHYNMRVRELAIISNNFRTMFFNIFALLIAGLMIVGTYQYLFVEHDESLTH